MGQIFGREHAQNVKAADRDPRRVQSLYDLTFQYSRLSPEHIAAFVGTQCAGMVLKSLPLEGKVARSDG